MDSLIFDIEKSRETSRLFSWGWEMIIDHTHSAYIKKWERIGAGRYNGAYYYSKEIVENIIPNVETTRNWITVNVQGFGVNHAIVFIHNNVKPSNYDWLKRYDDLILVCGIKETVPKVEHLGRAVYLPLSIDTEYVKQFSVEEKTKGTAFIGRKSKLQYGSVPGGVDIISGLPREELLKVMAEYRNVYAVGRTAIEARCLNCRIKSYDKRYPDTRRWRVIDNRDAARMLQRELNKIDGRK